MAKTEKIEIPIEAIDGATNVFDDIAERAKFMGKQMNDQDLGFDLFSEEMTRRSESFMAVEKQKAAALKESAAAQKRANEEQHRSIRDGLLSAQAAINIAKNVYQAAEATYEFARAGAELDGTLDEFEQFESRMVNMKEEAQILVSRGITPLIENINDLADASEENNHLLVASGVALELNGKEMRLARADMQNLTDAQREQISAYQDAIVEAESFDKAMMNSAATQAQASDTSLASAKALSDSIDARINLIDKIQDTEERYTEKSEELAEQRLETEAELASLRAQGYWEGSNQIQGALEDLDEITQKEADLAAARAEQSLQFVSDILAQNLARDGWTENEFEAFAAQQVAWGLWSEDVATAAQQAMTDADNITEAINRIPTERTFTLTTFVGVGTQEVASLTGANNTPHAAGGSFTIPAAYGNEGFMLGNGDTASAGEKLTIDPAGSSGNADVIAAIQDSKLDAKSLARAFVSAMQQAGIQ